MENKQAQEYIDVLIIGAGQAGLALGAELIRREPRLSMLLLERHSRIGDNWRERYDSLILFTPRKYSELPGLPLPGDPEGFPGRDEIADYLERYAQHWQLPVRLDSDVEQVAAVEDGISGPPSFLVTLRGQERPLRCRKLVLASGPFRTPFIPEWAASIGGGIAQLHSSQYQRPSQLPDGPALIVGGGNSGAQIAVELSQSRPTILSARGPARHLPLRLLNRSTFEWMDRLTLLHAPADGKRARWLRRKGDPIFGCELRNAVRSGRIRLFPEAVGSGEDGAVVLFRDHASFRPAAIVWATGFRPDYRWLQLPGALDGRGQLIYRGHRTPAAGLYVIGMPWQQSRSSALLCGAGRDARQLADELLRD
ncbi:MAG: NAD(P)/FAD-dependent oxidoreductase [Paenibacillus dendritiformis]|uniref:flavin-containing monooxygenase n=1 Tax=Paenibacillus dendritiformis TaxID=130049 RepID=UPI001AFE73D8|nr:NAD(P)/FAD-dependent oxidoreductase [Paenibacillus dendritiformis]MDU5141642.1 NAD(P)/FAD-dependent oxidoreductase [Paenibacillus dendritiformis]GIO71805.1 oxidoreductase [Paenibacillus dendritiformis]